LQWDPKQYLGYADLRLRPGMDLMAAIPLARADLIYDLGCGAGQLTQLLQSRWPLARVTGLDSSPDMLAKARTLSGAGQVEWREADIADFEPAQAPDLIFSNAVLHWLDDHGNLFAKLFDMLAPGGVLAIQMPRNHGAPSHTTMIEAAASGPWKDTLQPLLRPDPVSPPDVYYDILSQQAADLSIWETEYLQVLHGPDPVKEWTKGTALKPLLDALEGEEQAAFEADYTARVRAAYPRRDDGATLFPFRRLFVLARSAGRRE